MQKTIDKIKRIKVDSLYGKKKHFNAADRKEKIHYWIGNPLIALNVITGSVLFFVLTDGNTTMVRFITLFLTLLSALLSGFQTYYNFPRKVEGHRRIGNRYLAILKNCDRLLGYIEDDVISNENFINKLEEIAAEIEEVNKESEAFPTSESDYNKAKKSIENGEEHYSDYELNI